VHAYVSKLTVGCNSAALSTRIGGRSMRFAGVCVSALLVVLLGIAAMSTGQTDPPKDGYVPDEATAIRIAEAVFIPIYGAKHVRSERPFHATLRDGVWTVRGSLGKPPKPGYIVFGGTMEAEIERATGRIISVYHLK
jgi:hypothetical protein